MNANEKLFLYVTSFVTLVLVLTTWIDGVRINDLERQISQLAANEKSIADILDWVTAPIAQGG